MRRLENCVIRETVWLLLRWIDGATTAAREGCGQITAKVTNEGRKEGSFWVPSVPNECEYLTDLAKTVVFV
ncbi:hypothetical protein TNCV_3349581 [Trichonephila clavipes]|nr:hypothetical protein TNCV_3349581 [Trichonephila clavipes]